MALLIRGGRLFDPANQVDQICSIYVESGVVKHIMDSEIDAEKCRNEAIKREPVCEIDARDYYVVPLLIQKGKGSLGEGDPADMMLLNTREILATDVDLVVNMGTKKPFFTKHLKGNIMYTIEAGELTRIPMAE